MRKPTFKQLQAVSRIAELGTITAAAAKLNLTASAISLTLKQIEKEAGLPLFELTESGLKTTEAGRAAVLAESRIAAILAELFETVSALKGSTRGKVAFGVVSTAKYFAPFILREFEKLHPRVEISLRVGNREDILARLEDYTLDMALIGRPPLHIVVEKQEIGPHPHVVIAAPDHPLARKRIVAASSLTNETFLVREPGSGTRLLTERILSEIGAIPKTGMEISSNETIKQAVMAGLGISLLSYHTVSHEIGEGRLVALRVEGTPVIRKWYVVKNSKKQILPSARSLWNFIATEGPRFLPPLKMAAVKR